MESNMSTQAVGGSLSTTANKSKNSRPTQITVKQGETLAILAKRYSMSVGDFIKWAGLKKASVSVGQAINLPTAAVPDGKGIMALIRKYGMTFEEFGKLNNLPKPYQEYVASKGEKFYVKHKKTQASTVKTSQAEKKTKTVSKAKPKPTSKPAVKNIPHSMTKSGVYAGAEAGAVVGTVLTRLNKWGSTYTPKELSSKIYEKSEEYWGAVGKPDFDALVKEINPKNAEDVIVAYKQNLKNKDKESLINTLASEIKSDKSARKAAVMHVYDSLAKAKNAPASTRQEFKTELDNQFGKLIGMVDTSKMDSIIDSMISTKKSQGTTKTANVGTYTPESKKSLNGGLSPSGKLRLSILKSAQDDLEKAFYNERVDSRGHKAPSYIDQMIKAIKNDSTLSPAQKAQKIALAKKATVDVSSVSRPYPVIDKSGKIDNTPKVTELKPTGKSNGKVIILNEGHGGFTSNSFDGGAFSFYEKPAGSNKYYPIEEYQVVKPYSRDLAKKLQAKGYTVVTFAGEAVNLKNRNTVANLTEKYVKKFGKSNTMFISLHSDSGTAKGSGVLYDPRDEKDKKLAASINNSLNRQSWVKAKTDERPFWGKDPKDGQEKWLNSLHVLTKTHDIPSTLLEIEYLGGARALNLTSSNYREQFVNGALEGIESYFKQN